MTGALIGAKVNPNAQWDRDVQEILHSLLGGNAKDLLNRRKCLENLFKNNPNLPVWEKGFLLHALGDTYAHSDANGNPYSFPLGHGAQGHNPDLISNNINNYKAYTNSLYSMFGGQPNAAGVGQINAIINKAAGFAPPPGWFRKFLGGAVGNEDQQMMNLAQAAFGYNNPYIPGDFNIDKNEFMPTHAMVQQFIDMVKKACCPQGGWGLTV